jgi:hypothetical protein
VNPRETQAGGVRGKLAIQQRPPAEEGSRLLIFIRGAGVKLKIESSFVNLETGMWF